MLPHTGVLRRFVLLSVLAHSSTCPENHSSLRHERSVHESVRGRLYANHNSDTILLGSRWAARTPCPTARTPALPCPCLSLLAKATVTPNGCWRNHSLGKKEWGRLFSPPSLSCWCQATSEYKGGETPHISPGSETHTLAQQTGTPALAQAQRAALGSSPLPTTHVL